MTHRKIKIIAISGVDGVGKSTLANIMGQRLKLQICPFAENVRKEIEQFYPHIDPSEIYDKPTSLKMRKLLRYHGLERTKNDDLYWVGKWLDVWNRQPTIVDDVRFMREITMLEGLGCYHVHLQTNKDILDSTEITFRDNNALKRRADYVFLAKHYPALDMHYKIISEINQRNKAWQTVLQH